MERKLKIMGIYISLLFFVSILLILITSLSNNKMDPTYQVEETTVQQPVGFNATMQDSVSKLTETNQKLNDKVKEQSNKITELENSLSEKDNTINNYKNKYNEDTENLIKALNLYIGDNEEDAETILEKVNRENLNPEYQTVYDNLLNKLQ